MERRDQMVTYARQLRTISDDLPDGPNRHGQMDTKTPTTRTTKPDKTTGETVRPDVPTETISGGKNDKWPENEPTVEQTYRARRTQPDRPDTSGKTNDRTK